MEIKKNRKTLRHKYLPKFFEFKGLKGLYNKLIMNLLFRSLASEKKKLIFEEIRENYCK